MENATLWGLGLSTNSQGRSIFLMHDGELVVLNKPFLCMVVKQLVETAFNSLSQADKKCSTKIFKILIK